MKRKGQPKPMAKKVVSSKPKAPAKQKVPKEGKCFHCGEKGHWKRNCKKYLEELKKGRAGKTTKTSGIYIIEVHNTSISSSWVLDTGSASHICMNLQGLRNRRKLN